MFKFLLIPFSWIYALIVGFRNFLYDVKILQSKSFDVPIISVGNITVGGTGKTPHVELLVRLLKDEHHIAVLSRGYKRKTKGFVLAEQTSKASEIGDELRQIKQKFPDILVAADGDRVRGVKKIKEIDDKIDLILLDDAFQHRHINPGLSVLLIDYNRPLDEDRYLPYGRLRESVSQIKRAHIVIVTKTPAIVKPIDMRVMSQDLGIKPYQSLFFTGLNYFRPVNVFPGKAFLPSLQRMKDESWYILAVTGIASPVVFTEHVKELSSNVEFLTYPDHYQFKPKDIEEITKRFNAVNSDKKIVLTTEKDAMRFLDCKISDKNLRERMLYLPVEPVFLNQEGEIKFKDAVKTYIRNATNDYKFYSSYKQHSFE